MTNELLYKQILLTPIPGIEDGFNTQMSFIMKLVEDNTDWTIEYASKAVYEYRRFLYLAMIVDAVGPSHTVDQVWHQHILYTRQYKEFCELFEREIHHGPNNKQTAKENQYHRNTFLWTLEMYRSEFNMEAPSDIWRDNSKYSMVNLTENYVIGRLDSRNLFKAFIQSLKNKLKW